MSDLGRGSICTNEHIHSEVISPEMPYLHSLQITWLTEILKNLFADLRLEMLVIWLCFYRMLLIVFFHKSRFRFY